MDASSLPLRLAECTWTEVDAFPRARGVLILPVGSTEAHGPHLPLATDVVISEAMALRAAELLRERGLPALVLPAVSYSVTDFAGSFPGSLSIRFETARDLVADVCAAAARQGFARLCVANSHLEPRHVESLAAAVDRVKAETGLAVAFPDKRRRRWAGALTDEFRCGACHAGQYEGSVVLAARPDLVREAVMHSLAPVEISLSDAIRAGKASFLEAGGDLAYFGRPADATADEGVRTIDALAEMLIASIVETFGIADAPHDND